MAAIIQTIEKPTRARALDTSGNNNHGQIYSGRALEFDGVTDYFQHNGGTALSGVNQFANGESWTFATWINFNDTKFTAFVGNDNSSKPFIGLHNSDFFQFRTASAGKYYKFDSTQTNALAGAEPLQENTWYRLVITAESDVLTCYLNGVQHGSTVTTSTNDTTNAVAFEGSAIEFSGWGGPYGSPRTHFLDGMMSDGQVWNASWTADDVTYDYLNPEQLALNNSGTSLTESNLKIWYPMNDGHRGQQSYILDASNTGLGDSLVSNSDMESYGGWQASNCEEHATGTIIPDDGVGLVHADETLKYTTDKSYSGTKSLYVNVNGGSEGIRQPISGGVAAGTTYKFSAWIWCPTGMEAMIGNDNSHFQDNVYVNTTLENQWEYIEMYATCDSGTTGASNIYIWSAATGEGEFYVDDAKVQPVNDKNHATTVFHGDMSNLLTSAQKTFIGDALDDNDNLFDFGGNNGDAGTTLIDSDGFTITNAHAVVGFYIAGNHGRLTNNASAQALATLPIATVTGRTYQVFYDVAEGSSNINVSLGSSAAYNSSNASANQNDGTGKSLATAYTADDATSFLALQLTSSTNTHYCDVDNLKIVEVGTASGWTDADQQLDIPQTALQSYNQLAWFPGVDPGTDISAKISDHASIDDIWTNGGTCSAWIYVNGVGAGGYGRIFDKAYWLIYTYSISGGQVKLAYTFSHNSGSNNSNGQTTARVLDVGKWYHVAMTYNSNSAASAPLIYVNGESVAVTEDDEGSGSYNTDNGQHLYIGNKGNGSRTFDGTITEASLWDEILTQAEVNELYNDGKAFDAFTHSNRTALICYVRNNGLATWSDLSSNSNNAVPTNLTETMLITAGADATRDSQGFLMNRQRATNSLNLHDVTEMGGMHVVVPNNPTLQFASGGSVAFWMKPIGTPDSNGYCILSNGAGGSRNPRITLLSNKKIKLFWEIADGTNKDTTADNALTTDIWTYVTCTWDGTTNKIYYNDALDTSESESGTPDTDTADLYIGIDQTLTHGHFEGRIDDLVIYSDILTLAEVKRNYNAGKRSHR